MCVRKFIHSSGTWQCVIDKAKMYPNCQSVGLTSYKLYVYIIHYVYIKYCTMCIHACHLLIVCTIGWFQKQLIRTRSMLEHFHRGQMKEFCSLISNLFLFFSWHLCVINHLWSKFSKTKGGDPLVKKSEKKDLKSVSRTLSFAPCGSVLAYS